MTAGLRDNLLKTRMYIREKLAMFAKKDIISPSLLDELEAVLIQADLGTETTSLIINEVKKKKTLGKEEIYNITRKVLVDMMGDKDRGIRENPSGPSVILLLGVNGAGKTTTAAKLAYRFKSFGRKSILAAGDTFRAAAVEQLEILAERAGADIVKHSYRADPSAVCYDAVSAAAARGTDYVLIDTAGRFHTKEGLVDELKKISRTAGKRCSGAPHEKLFVIDAVTGQNGIAQAEVFHKAVGLTGIIITKLDGTAKGGAAVSIQRELRVPVKFIGTGQGLEDIEEFVPEKYANALV